MFGGGGEKFGEGGFGFCLGKWNIRTTRPSLVVVVNW